MKNACRPQLQQALFATMSYFDLMEYPLTLLETKRWLWSETASIGELAAALEQHDDIVNTKGFYHLRDREHIVEQRMHRYAITEHKIRKLRPYLRWLGSLPHVEAIMISDSIGLHNANEDSDLDIAIITKAKKIWSTRFWATFPAKILGLRPKLLHEGGVNKKNKICLCFYTTTNHLNLEHERITKPDVDFVYWLASMFPIYDPHNMYKKVIHANRWLKNYLPNYTPYQSVEARTIEPFRQNFLTRLLKSFSPEDTLKTFQQKILHPRLRELAKNNDTRVILNDSILKLHMNDQRLELQEQWQRKMGSL